VLRPNAPSERHAKVVASGWLLPNEEEFMDVLDAAGRRRSPATLAGYGRRRPPRNKGLRFPPTVEEIVAVINGVSGLRLRAVVVVMRRRATRLTGVRSPEK
jgi:hypothetical protein